jgi:hypothetical protein
MLDNTDPGFLDHDDDGSVRADWVAKICAAHDKSAQAIIELGKTLNDAKAALHQRGQWMTMFEGNELPFSLSLAERYMRIALRFPNSASLQNLPSAVSTLYELSRLSDDEFEQGVKDGSIHADMTGNEAREQRSQPSSRSHMRKNNRPLPANVTFDLIKSKIDGLVIGVRQKEIKIDADFRKNAQAVKVAVDKLMRLLKAA